MNNQLSETNYEKYRCTEEKWFGRCTNPTTPNSYRFSMDKYKRPICFSCQSKMKDIKK